MGKEYVREMLQSGEAHHIGSIHYTENFEHGITWEHSGSGGVYEAKWSKDEALMGKYAAYLKQTIVTPVATDKVYIENSIYMPYNKRISGWTFFRVPDFSNCWYLGFQWSWYDGATGHHATFFYDPDTELWQYRDADGVAQDITGSDQSLYPNTWHKVKFSADYENDEYLELWCNTMRIDLSGIALETAAEPLIAENFWMVLSTHPYAAGYTELFLDDIMVTEYGIS